MLLQQGLHVTLAEMTAQLCMGDEMAHAALWARVVVPTIVQPPC